MPTKKLRRQHAAAGHCDKRFVQRGPDTVDRLAFKYMEMCKVDSSSDSESEASPRWSDVSSKSFQVQTGHKRPILPQKSFGRYCQHPLDPYDGSSEDSASSADASKRQKHGGFKMKGRSRRVAPNLPPLHKEVMRVGPRDGIAVHLSDVQMRSSSDSELKTVNQRDSCPCRAIKFSNAEISENTKSPIHSTATPFGIETSFQLTDDLLKNPIHPGILSKRKLFCPLGESEESTRRKKQCIAEMETETFSPEG